MMERNKKHGAREAPDLSLWVRYKMWVTGLDRGQKIRYRLLQTATILSLVVIVGYAALSAWIRVPNVPDDTRKEPAGQEDGSGDLSFEGAEGPDTSSENGRKKGVYTFLVAGRDVISGSTDTMLLVTYDTVNKTIFGLNLPRDTMVNVSTSSKRLNAVYSYNRGKDKETQTEKGMAALKEEVAELTGIVPDFYVLVEWEAIGELVDAIGGVEFEVPFLMDYKDPEQDLVIYQEPGLRLLDGDDAMQVIRHRKNSDGSHSNGDVGRLKIQQDFLRAVAKKCLQPAILLKAPALAKIFMENVRTDLTVGNILAFAQLASGMDAENGVDFQTAPLASSFSYRGAALVTLDGEELLTIVNEKMNPYTRQIELSDLELLYRKSDGSFGVTSGSLADAAMARPPAPAAPKPAQEDPKEDEPEQPPAVPPEGTEEPGTEQPGGEEPGTEQPGTGEPGTEGPAVTIDPEQVLPDPGGQEVPGGQETPDVEKEPDEPPAWVLPSLPEPVSNYQ